jgi:hypothetical protein
MLTTDEVCWRWLASGSGERRGGEESGNGGRGGGRRGVFEGSARRLADRGGGIFCGRVVEYLTLWKQGGGVEDLGSGIRRRWTLSTSGWAERKEGDRALVARFGFDSAVS